QARHVLLAMRVGHRLQVLRAMAFELVQFAIADEGEGLLERRMLEVARGLASRTGDEGRLYIEAARGLALYMRGRFREGLEVLDWATAAAGQQGIRNSAAGGNI